jgi:hypothetical protein
MRLNRSLTIMGALIAGALISRVWKGASRPREKTGSQEVSFPGGNLETVLYHAIAQETAALDKYMAGAARCGDGR